VQPHGSQGIGSDHANHLIGVGERLQQGRQGALVRQGGQREESLPADVPVGVGESGHQRLDSAAVVERAQRQSSLATHARA